MFKRTVLTRVSVAPVCLSVCLSVALCILAKRCVLEQDTIDSLSLHEVVYEK